MQISTKFSVDAKRIISTVLNKRTGIILGWVLLAVTFVLGSLGLYFGKHVDEADNLVVGLLIRQGDVLYRDVFSHHFPFPYYWTALVILFFGKSILAIRFSLWVLEIGALGVAMKFSRFHLALGLFALLWSLMRYLYLGNMLLYHSFAGIGLTVVYAIVLSNLLGISEPGLIASVIIGIFSTIAVLSDPFTVFPLAVAGLLLLVSHPKAAFAAGGVILGFLSIYLGYLVISGTLGDFWSSAVVFNADVYNAYNPVNIFNFSDLYHSLVSGLDITNPAWYKFAPFREIGNNFDTWFFTAFLYRFSFVAGSLILLLQKKSLPAILVYLTGSVLLIKSDIGMAMTGFVMVSLVSLFILITNEGATGIKSRPVNIVRILVSVFSALMVCWLGFRVALNDYVKRADFSNAPLTMLEWKGGQIREKACNTQDVLLADFPNGIYSYWFSGYAPATKYIFLWPWVADVGQADIIAALDKNQEKPVLVYMTDMKVWNKYRTTEYLADLYGFLDHSYVKVEDGVYMSPGLARSCSVATK